MNDPIIGFLVAGELSCLFWAAVFILAG